MAIGALRPAFLPQVRFTQFLMSEIGHRRCWCGNSLVDYLFLEAPDTREEVPKLRQKQARLPNDNVGLPTDEGSDDHVCPTESTGVLIGRHLNATRPKLGLETETGRTTAAGRHNVFFSRAARPLGARTLPLAVNRPTDRARIPQVHAPSTTPLDNKLLASLPRREFDVLATHLITVVLPQGHSVYEAGGEVEQVYFPHNGMFSLLAVMRDGKAIETATVGREGVVGAMAGLGLYKSLVRVNVQLPMTASRIPSAAFRRSVTSSQAIRDLCIGYNEVLLTQARITAACNALHPIDQRFCRWLLQSADRAASDTVMLTQELLADMLGVRRTSVTEVAIKVQDQGIITYARGVIKILDRGALERMSCECYRTLVEYEATLTN